MLEALFELFFRVLKHAAAAPVLRGASAEAGLICRGASGARVRERVPLLYAALQGLGKYTHLIGLEYFTDLLAAFQGLLGCVGLPRRERLRCLLTVDEIMRAQGDALNVDRRAFFLHLYEALALAPLQPLADLHSSAVRDSDNTARGAQSDVEAPNAVLLAECAQSMLGALKIGDSARLAAFAKRLCASALHCDTALSLALLAIANRFARPATFHALAILQVAERCLHARCMLMVHV